MMTCLTWLHLSDWHQKSEDFDRKVVREALIKDIKERIQIHKNLENLDFIVFSGDVAFSGKKEEYKAAEELLLAPLLDATGLDKNRLFIVPGNHDLDRDTFKFLSEKILRPLTSDDDIKEWLSKDEERDYLLRPFKAYNEFVKPYADGNLTAYACCYELTVEDKKVALLGFNSALMSGRHRDEKGEVDDYGQLILAEPQIYKTLQENSDADVRIVLLHHPFEWLTEKDRNTVKRRLKKNVHFILCGHQHMGAVTIETGTEGDCITIPAGAAYNRRIEPHPQYPNAYNFVHLDFKKNIGVAYLRCWSERAEKWREDVDAYADGQIDFILPKDLMSLVKDDEGQESPGYPFSSHETYDLNNPVFNVPFRAKGEGMVGQEKTLQKVREQLIEGKRTAIGHTAAFQGLGGLGKTQLAVEYAHRYRSDYPNGVIWINADLEIDVQLIQMAKQAQWISPESKHYDILTLGKRRLKEWSECLIIFDNVTDIKNIEPYTPDIDATPHLLLTSRAPQKGFHPVEISLLDDELSLNLLLKESARNFDSLSEKEQMASREIAHSLGGLPLAIEIAGAYLSHIPACTFQEYRTILKENLKEAMKGDLLSSFTQHEERNLFLTLQVSRPVLNQAPLLKEILDLLAWSGNSFMGISLMAAILEKKESELYHPLALGTSLHLLQKTTDAERYDIHQLVRRVRQEQFPIIDRIQWVKNVCQRLGDWFEKRKEDFMDLPDFEAEIDHLKEWLGHVKPYSSNHACRLTWLQSYPPYRWGEFDESLQLVLSAFSLLEEIPGFDPKLKANILDHMGTIYNALGNLAKGLDYQKKALEIRLEILGEKHADSARSLNNVGIAYGQMGNPNEALKYHVRALEIQRQLLKKNNKDIAKSLNNVGATYVNLGNFDEAFKHQKLALEIQLGLFGEQHPDTALSIDNIGSTYGCLGDNEEALKHQKKALELELQLFGEQHPDTARTLYNIGDTYSSLGNQKEALKYKKHALEIRRKLYGENHRSIAQSLHNIGISYYKLIDYNRALIYFEQAFKIQCQLVGETSPDKSTILGNIIVCTAKLKRFQEASERLDDYLDQLPQDQPEYRSLFAIKKFIHKEKIRCKRTIPSNKKKKKKRK